jgi:site-specific recombinase XerD
MAFRIPGGFTLDMAQFWHNRARQRSNFVFCNGGGRQFPPNQLSRELERAAAKAGLEGVTLHTLRHTFGSQLVQGGVDLPTVSDLMGHSDIKSTMLYMHRTPDHLAKSVNKFRL